jgi:hypothetical protein
VMRLKYRFFLPGSTGTLPIAGSRGSGQARSSNPRYGRRLAIGRDNASQKAAPKIKKRPGTLSSFGTPEQPSPRTAHCPPYLHPPVSVNYTFVPCDGTRWP